AGASIFNTGLNERVGFVPISAEVTDALDEDQKILMVGLEYRFISSDLQQGYSGAVTYGALGKSSPVALRTVHYPDAPEVPVYKFIPFVGPVPRIAMCAKASNDVLMPFVEEHIRLYLWRWNGIEQTYRSLSMGYGFVPRAIRGAHANATDTWLVGHGFALKRATP
ncbi:MAG: hypothetical protein K0S65_6718, partial [Labilithrix sp.]|nr:hypothetical protein [Labilithrix sp.]